MFFLCSTYFSFTDGDAVAGNVYYISPAGSDTTGTGIKSNPWRTLKKAHDKPMVAGDTLYCRGGVYLGHTQFSWTVTGTQANPITIKNYSSENPKFINIGSGGYLMSIRGSNWLTIDGLEIEGYFSGLYIRGNPYEPDPSPVTDFAKNITIKNCYLHDSGEHGIYVSSGCKNIKIYNNLIENPTKICIQNWHTPGSDGLEIYNNIFVGGTLGLGVGIGAKNLKIYNNTFYAQKINAVGFYGSPTNVVFKNNIIYETKDGVRCIYSNNSSQATLSAIAIDYNLYYKTGTGTFAYWNGTNYKTLADWVSKVGKDVHSVNADPLFVSTGKDFHLRSSSPAKDTGTSAVAPTKDFDGNSRPQGSGYDKGAYEYRVSSGCNLNFKFQQTTLQSGMTYYTDRSYTFTKVPSKYIGMDMIKSPNNDRNNTCGSGYVTFTKPSTGLVYVAYDRRATKLPSWMNGFSYTGDIINTSLSSQGWLKVYSKQFSGGACVNLGCNKGSGFSGGTTSNYIVFSGTSSGANNCALASKFQQTTLQNGMPYYTDRLYTLTSVPSKYVGLDMFKTPNNDRLKTCGSGYVTFKKSSTGLVYVAYDRRATSLPDWMNGFSYTGDIINTSLSTQGWLKVYRKQFSGGACVNLGCNKGPGFTGGTMSNYIVIIDD